jgi:hypothetical protein
MACSSGAWGLLAAGRYFNLSYPAVPTKMRNQQRSYSRLLACFNIFNIKYLLEKYWLVGVGVRRSKAATVSNAKRHTVVMTASKTSQKKKGKSWVVGRKYY